jgi:cell division inhibitor SulA
VVSIDQSIYPEHQPMIVHVLLIVVSIDQNIYPEHQPMIVHVLLIVVSIIKSTIMGWCSG